jgi:hypothetical protein
MRLNEGRLVVRFTVSPDGVVTSTAQDGESPFSSDLFTCISSVLRKTSFPARPSQDANVVLPMQFSRTQDVGDAGAPSDAGVQADGGVSKPSPNAPPKPKQAGGGSKAGGK